MVILSAIGRFFKKIWDWIKQTAWIQPLLIVGLIFGVIFSIPAIVNAVKNGKAAQSKYASYFHRFSLSLKNEAKSEVDDFTTKLYTAMTGDNKDFEKSYGDKCGDKFFVAYVSRKKCDNCTDAKDAFSIFEDKFNKTSYFKSKEFPKEEFKLVTIFMDDENNETTKKTTAFSKYVARHQDFFEKVGSDIADTPYCASGKINKEALESFETANDEDFYAPTILLVELGNKATKNHTVEGVTELMFGVAGSDKYDKALTLLDCWNHTGDFSDNPND